MNSKIKRDILFFIMIIPCLMIIIILYPFGKVIDFTVWADKKLNKWSGYDKNNNYEK